MAYEDISTFTEVDENGDITLTSSKCAWDTMRYDAESYVYKSYGSGHFGEYDIDFTMHCSASDASGITIFWMVSDTVGDYFAQAAANDGILGYDANGGNWYMWDFNTDNTDSSAWPTKGTTNYATAQRSGTTATIEIYSDAARTSLEDTMSITCHEDTKEYLYACSTIDGAGADTHTGYTENIDLNEAAGGLSIPVAMHHYTKNIKAG